MATISENKKNGKTVSYRFVICLGRDAQKKQIRRFMTWTPPADMSPAKAKKAAVKAADAWEQEVRAEYRAEEEAKASGRVYSLPPEKRADDFVGFINDVWFPLQVQGNGRKPKTISFYASMVKIIAAYFQGYALQGISSVDIQKYLSHLRTEYKGKAGQPLTPKTVHHQYNTLNLIFSYAEKQGVISKNPMRLIDAPKKQKHPVDALSQEQAAQFFRLLPECPLDFRCILHLLITTGIRRGECMGLKWKDLDEKTCTLTIERNVTYTPESGIVVSTPKTANSIRTIPVMPSTLQVLLQLKEQVQNCQLSSLHRLPQSVVLPRIAEHPGVVKKRNNKGTRYYGVGIRKPVALTESMKILDELSEKSAAQCRADELDLDNWENLIF